MQWTNYFYDRNVSFLVTRYMLRNMGVIFRRKWRNGWWLNMYNPQFHEIDLFLTIII
jgi:hypothetical protein